MKYFTPKELGTLGASESAKENMYLLVTLCLNRIRERYGPVIITSGYRSPEYNESLRARGYNPSRTSQHLTGGAADFIIRGVNMHDVYKWLKQWWPGQIIYYSKKGHVHVGLPTQKLEDQGRLKAWIDPK